MGKYKYLLWDVDGTVLDFIAAEKAAMKALFIKYGLGECTDEMVSRYSAINAKYWLMLETGEMTKPEILTGRFREFFREEGIEEDIADCFNMDYQLALGDTIVYCENALEILKSQKGSYVLAAITNGTRRAQSKKLAVSGLDRIFDYIFISEDVGAEKPAAEFFEKVISDIGISDPDEALVIGDSLTSDITGGNNAGFPTCWYNPKRLPGRADIVPDFEIHSLSELGLILG